MTHIRRCKRCASYGLSDTCECGAETNTVRPPRYSPDDPHGEYRRQARLTKLNE